MRFTAVLLFFLGMFSVVRGAKADNLILNPTFTSTNQTYPGYTTSTDNLIGGWSGTALTGATTYNGNGFWDNGSVPAGTDEVGFIQASGSLSTTMENLTVGQLYELDFLYNSRSNSCCNATPSLSVDVDGTSVLNNLVISPVGDTNPFSSFTGYFVAGSTSQTLTFTSMTAAGTDGTALLTDVSASAVTPEPSSLALLGTGLIAGANVLRRRYANA